MSLSVVIFSGCFNITERYKNRNSFSLARSSSDLCSIFVLALVIVAGRHPKNKLLEWWSPLAQQTYPGEALEISEV